MLLTFAPPTALSYLQQLLATQPASRVAYWPFDEATGAVARELIAGRDGAYTGVTLGQTGIGDGTTAPFFDSTDRVNLLTSGLASAFNGAEGSISLWCKVTDASIWTDATVRYALFLSADASNQVYIRRSATNNQLFAAHVGGGVTKSATIPTSSLGWINLIWTWSALAGQGHIWVNGEPGADPSAGLGTFAGLPTTIVAGASNTSGASPWRGYLAHPAMWATTLGPGDVAVVARKAGLLFFEGDSRTKGTTSPYPTQMMARSEIVAKNYGWSNIGVSGQTVADMSADAATQVDAQRRAVLGRNIVAVWGGVNDAAAGADAATIYARLKSYWAGRRLAGYRVIACTEIDAQDASRNAVSWHSTLYPALNTLIKSDPSLYDALADLGADARLQDATNLTYFNADKVHLTDAGYGVVAGIVATPAAAL